MARHPAITRPFATAIVLGTAVLSLSLVIGHAASLGLASGGIVLTSRSHGSPISCTLTASADTVVRRDQPSSSFGGQSSLEISNSATATQRVLISFDLTACSPAIASDVLVHSATIRLTTTTLTTASARDYVLYAATGAWTESTTWSTQPSVAAAATSTVTIPVLTVMGTVIAWPAARDVQAFVASDEPNLGWRINDSVENGGLLDATSITFNSREAGSGRPQLVVTYAP